MGLIHKDTFICFDCEATGLDPEKDKIIEIAVAKFTFSKILETKEDLIDPRCPIPPESIEIHHITDSMVQGKPKIQEVLPAYLEIIDRYILVGHGIPFDIALIENAARLNGIPCRLSSLKFLDTLRMARLYGDSPTNSLAML